MDSCRRCAAPRDPRSADSLAWACERDADGSEHWLCPTCARRHLRDIEAKLPAEWW